MQPTLIAIALCALMGCRGAPADVDSPTEGGGGPVVASHGDEQVTVTELQAFLDGFPAARRPEVAPAEGRLKFLRNYLLYRSALRRATAAGYADDPRILRARDREMVLRWTEDRMASYQPPPITDAEVRARWEQDQRPMRPKRVRARHILIPDRTTADALRADLLAALNRAGVDAEAVFAGFAREHCLDQKTRSKGGDLLFFSRSRDEMAWRLAPAAVLEAALAMQNVGQVSLPLAGPSGFHLVMLTGRRDAARPTLEDETSSIRTALARERAEAARKAVETELLDMNDWTVDHRALRDLVVEPELE